MMTVSQMLRLADNAEREKHVIWFVSFFCCSYRFKNFKLVFNLKFLIQHTLLPVYWAWMFTGAALISDVNKTKFLIPRPRPREVNKGIWRI